MVMFTMPLKTMSELNARGSWRKSYTRKKIHRSTARLYMLKAMREQGCDVPMRVTLTRVAPRKLDEFDNLPASLKACVDGICDALGIADNDPLIRLERPKQERGKPHEYAVRVEIET